jgi:Phosphotransferase enzyme family
MPSTARVGRHPVAGSVDELVHGATSRAPLHGADGKSGAQLERVVIDGQRFVLKLVDRRRDWIARQVGDIGVLPVVVWERGIGDLAPDVIDHTIVGAARGTDGAAVLMRDASDALVPDGDEPIPLEQHLRYLDHMAAFHAGTWGWADDVGLVPLANRYLFFAPAALALELAAPSPPPVVSIASEGWARLPERSPDLASVVFPLLEEPWPLLDPLAAEPSVFLHGDWKLGNLGTGRDGRTVLVDWSLPGAGPPCTDLVHYVVLNRARLPIGHTKDDAFAVYRTAMTALGIDTDPWWDRQLLLCILGAMLQLGWEKALGDDDELAWWTGRAIEGARVLLR